MLTNTLPKVLIIKGNKVREGAKKKNPEDKIMLMWHLGRISYFNKKCIKDYNVSFEKIDTDETTGKQSKATDAECSNKRLEG